MSDDPFSGPAAGSAEPPLRQLPIRFVGSGSEFFRIWIVNLLLTLVTLGLYYPFAKVRRLRYFHGATEVGGHPLGFHADPWKMFRGYVLVALMLGAYSGAGQFSALAGGIAFLIVAALWPALWHSSMRFRLANTSWRGLRLRYTGTLRQAYMTLSVPLLAAMALVLATLLSAPEPTQLPGPDDAPPAPPVPPVPPSGMDILLILLPMLGVMLLMPLFFWLLKRLQHRNFALGAEQTRFDAGIGSFYGLAFKTAGVGLLAIALVVALVMGGGFLMGAFEGGAPEGTMVLTVILVMLSYLLVFALAGGFWVARLQDLVWNRTASAHIGFTSRLRARALTRLWFKNTLLVLVTLGLYFPFAQVASARLRLQAVTVGLAMDPDDLAASAGRHDEAAAGDAAGDLLGFDIGL